jgi:hypothetical protein
VKFAFFVVERNRSAPCCQTPIRLTTKITKSTKGLNAIGPANLVSFWSFKLDTVGEFAVIEVTLSDFTARNTKNANKDKKYVHK